MNRSLVNGELTLFSYEILGLVGSGGAGPHDLLRMAQRGRILAWAGESQYYVEPKRLAKLGYLAADLRPRRRGRHPREPGDAARRHRRSPAAPRRLRANGARAAAPREVPAPTSRRVPAAA